MLKVFSHSNALVVQVAKCQFELNDIASLVKEEHLQASISLPPFDRGSSLWLESTNDQDMALKLLRCFENEDEGGVVSDWYCNECKENNDPSFEWCWSCQYDRHSHVKH